MYSTFERWFGPAFPIGTEPADLDGVAPVYEFGTREQIARLVAIHKAWLVALREAGKCSLGADACRNDMQACELYLRAWWESALSITACGVGTGVPVLVTQQLQRYGFNMNTLLGLIDGCFEQSGARPYAQ